MANKITIDQLSFIANTLWKRFKENPDLFTLIDPPNHKFTVALTQNLRVAFIRDGTPYLNEIDFTAGFDMEAFMGFPPFHPIRVIRFILAKRKLWKIAEAMLQKVDRVEKTLYDLFPEMLENNIRGK
jgi:hypothetical protein